jgi:SAM-dependent methyltransferase
MPLRLSPLETLLSWLNVLPTPLFDIPLEVGIARVLVTACELELFDILERENLSLVDLAERIHCHPQGLELLLQILVSSGYLRYRKGMYANTGMTRRWLTSSSSHNIAPYIVHSPDIVAIWDHLPEVVRTGRPAMRMPYDEDASSEEMQRLLARHYAGLAALGTALGGDFIKRIYVPPTATRLLDVGGSHAAYSVLLCQKYPQLHATILDIQPGIEAGQRTAKQFQMEDRMSFVCGDIVRDDFAIQFPESFDVACYFQIAHLLQPEVNQMVLARVARTLKPGGMLIFLDQVTDQPRGSRLTSLMVQFMALTMATVGGTCYPFSVVKDWLEGIGLGQVRRHRVLTPGATMITAIKQ